MYMVWTLPVTGILLLFLYWMYRHFRASYQLLARLGIKGPKPDLLFGNLHLITKLGVLRFSNFLVEKYGPVSGYYFGPEPVLLIVDLDILKHVMVKEFDSFMDRPKNMSVRPKHIPPGLFLSRGKHWKVARHTLSPTFSAAKMKLMVPLIEKSVKSLLKNMQKIADSKLSTNIFRVFGLFTMETIVATAFGRMTDIQGGENDELVNAANYMFRRTASNKTRYIMSILKHFPILLPLAGRLVMKSRQGAVINNLRGIAMNLVKERREAGQHGMYKDLLQLMIDASVQEKEGGESCPVSDKKLTDEQIVSHSTTFLLAGYETTANTLAYTSYLLALNPDIQERLQSEIDNYMNDNPNASPYEATQDISYLDMVIHESLRIYPPVPWTPRLCVKTVTVNDLTIPEGVSVMVPIAQLHKDPQYWEEPEKFNPERFTPEEKAKRPQLCYMPFGHGPRNCIGMRFALLEAKLALIEVLRKFTFVRAPDTEIPLQTVIGVTMSPKNGIFINVEPRV